MNKKAVLKSGVISFCWVGDSGFSLLLLPIYQYSVIINFLGF